MLPALGSRRSLDVVLENISTGILSLDCGDEDIPRIRQLVERYDDLGLGFADATVIACAERHGGRILTFDRRDFEIVAREGTITIVP